VVGLWVRGPGRRGGLPVEPLFDGAGRDTRRRGRTTRRDGTVSLELLPVPFPAIPTWVVLGHGTMTPPGCTPHRLRTASSPWSYPFNAGGGLNPKMIGTATVCVGVPGAPAVYASASLRHHSHTRGLTCKPSDRPRRSRRSLSPIASSRRTRRGLEIPAPDTGKSPTLPPANSCASGGQTLRDLEPHLVWDAGAWPRLHLSGPTLQQDRRGERSSGPTG
jgi:hypothetical protein